jgi:hypothetical protein
MLRDLVVRKTKKLEFRHIFQKTKLCALLERQTYGYLNRSYQKAKANAYIRIFPFK